MVDVYVRPRDSLISTAVDIVKRLGSGGIIYVPPDLRDIVDELLEALNKNGVKAASYLKPSKSLLNDFVEGGKIDVLIGLATSRSSLVRGH